MIYHLGLFLSWESNLKSSKKTNKPQKTLAFWIIMSTSQNHCHRLSVTKPKIWLLIKQILSSKVLLVTSKEEAPDILNSGTATMFWTSQHSAVRFGRWNLAVKICMREAREHSSSPAVFPAWVLDNILIYADKGHFTSLMKSTDPARGDLWF